MNTLGVIAQTGGVEINELALLGVGAVITVMILAVVSFAQLLRVNSASTVAIGS